MSIRRTVNQSSSGSGFCPAWFVRNGSTGSHTSIAAVYGLEQADKMAERARGEREELSQNVRLLERVSQLAARRVERDLTYVVRLCEVGRRSSREHGSYERRR